MDRQISEMKVKPNRFVGFNFKRCKAWDSDNLIECLKKKKYRDCVASGVNWGAIQTHGSQGGTELERNYHIVSNVCSHKRMMKEMYNQWQESNSTKKYAVLLEDDVAFQSKEFMRK